MVWALIVGLIVGAIAKLLMPGKDPGGFIITMIVGVAGSILANFVGTQMGMYESGEPAGFIASVVGAVILLAIYRAIVGRSNRPISHH
jgi:uncharacterized membrane protein YeaQ/YmgE (transglycosylase-associated protein family)